MLVVRHVGGTVDRDGLLAHLADRVVKWWLPEDILFVEALPHTATGKVLKLRLREQYGDHRVAPAGEA